jgi:hypothetical protein
LIYKYFASKSLFPKDQEGIVAKSLIPKDRYKGGGGTRYRSITDQHGGTIEPTAKSLIYKYFTNKSLFPKDLERIVAKSLIPKDRHKGDQTQWFFQPYLLNKWSTAQSRRL